MIAIGIHVGFFYLFIIPPYLYACDSSLVFLECLLHVMSLWSDVPDPHLTLSSTANHTSAVGRTSQGSHSLNNTNTL